MATRSPLRSRPGPGDGDQPRVHLAGDDVRERRLAEPGRPRQQHVVDRLAALLGGRERDRELLAHDLLPDELVELRGRSERSVSSSSPRAASAPTRRSSSLMPGLPRRSAASAYLDALLGAAVGCRPAPPRPRRRRSRARRARRAPRRCASSGGRRARARRARRPRAPRRRACRATRRRCARRCACRCRRRTRAAPDAGGDAALQRVHGIAREQRERLGGPEARDSRTGGDRPRAACPGARGGHARAV